MSASDFSLDEQDDYSYGSNSMSSGHEVSDDLNDLEDQHLDSDGAGQFSNSVSSDGDFSDRPLTGYHGSRSGGSGKRKQYCSTTPPRHKIQKARPGSTRSGGKQRQRHSKQHDFQKERSYGDYGSKNDRVTLPDDATQHDLSNSVRPGAAHSRSRPRIVQHPGADNLRPQNRSHAAKAKSRLATAPKKGNLKKLLNQVEKAEIGFLYRQVDIKRGATAKNSSRRVGRKELTLVRSNDLTVRVDDHIPRIWCDVCKKYLTVASTRDITGVGAHLTGGDHLDAIERQKTKAAKGKLQPHTHTTHLARRNTQPACSPPRARVCAMCVARR
jgi:hypothetical protein